MSLPRPRSATQPAVKLSVGDGNPIEDREALAERRRSSPSLPPPPMIASARTPFAWLLVVDDASADAVHGPDWAW